MKIVVIGGGVVGKSIASVLSKDNIVTVLDHSGSVVLGINGSDVAYEATIDNDVLADPELELVIVAVQTPGMSNGKLDVSNVHYALDLAVKLNVNPIPLVVASTMDPHEIENMGLSQRLVIHMPEFIRGSTEHHLTDAHHPDRIVLGSNYPIPKELIGVLVAGRTNAVIYCTSLTEAAVIKLGSNAYLAMRQIFFTELGRICDNHSLDTNIVIGGICSDKRIGDQYNVPNTEANFGHCLPKDTSAYYDFIFGTHHNLQFNSILIRSVLDCMGVKS